MKPWREYGRYGSIGIEMALCIALGTWLGSKGDQRFGTAPWLALFGIVVGVFAAFRSLFATARFLERDVERQERELRGEDPWQEPPRSPPRKHPEDP